MKKASCPMTWNHLRINVFQLSVAAISLTYSSLALPKNVYLT